MTQFDLLIVGAGPAGSFAAELLAKGGAKVALFDGRPAGEPKACGGGVTAKALKAWPNLLNAVGRTIHELDLYSPSGKRLHLKLDEPFAVYSRVAFDGYLRDRARDAGAHVVAEKVSARKIKKTDDGWLIRDRLRRVVRFSARRRGWRKQRNRKNACWSIGTFRHGSGVWLSRSSAGERPSRQPLSHSCRAGSATRGRFLVPITSRSASPRRRTHLNISRSTICCGASWLLTTSNAKTQK